MKNIMVSLAMGLLMFGMTTIVNAASIGVGNNSWYTDTLRQNLIAQGHSVTIYNSYDSSVLSGLDAYIQEGNSFFNAALLDQFVLSGGTLIEIPWSFTHDDFTQPTTIMGERTGLSYGQSNPGINVLDPTSWLLTGVTLPNAGQYVIGRETGNVFAPGANQVLTWADGTAMLGYAAYGEGMVVGLNLHLITSDSSPLNADWSNQIVYNAINGDTAPVPEPGTMMLLGLGMAGLAIFGKRRAKKNEA